MWQLCARAMFTGGAIVEETRAGKSDGKEDALLEGLRCLYKNTS